MGYPLNAITLVPAAKAELYLVQPDGTPFANQTVTLRGGVYLEDNYCGEDVRMGPDSNSLVPGNTDGTYTTDGEGKLTVHMTPPSSTPTATPAPSPTQPWTTGSSCAT